MKVGPEVTVRVSGELVAVRLVESVTLNTRPETVCADAARVPEIAPVEGLRDRLAGSAPLLTDHV